MGSISLAYVVPKLAKVWVTCWIGMRFCRYPGVHERFYDGLNQTDNIFSSKVINVTRNSTAYNF